MSPEDASILTTLVRHGNYLRSGGPEAPQFLEGLELAGTLPANIVPLGVALVHQDRTLLEGLDQEPNRLRYDYLTSWYQSLSESES